MAKVLVNKIIETENVSMGEVFGRGGRIYTFLNPVSYLDAMKYRELFEQFDGIWADGSLLAKAIKVAYGKTVTRRSFDMTSMVPELLEYVSRSDKTVYIVASNQEHVERAVEIFHAHYPRLNFAGYRNGYFFSEDEMNVEAQHIVKEVMPDFLIVGMGIVMQERFLLKVKHVGFQGVGFTCGGFIHQTAKNEIDYYPIWMDRYNLRFMYRMFRENYTRKRYAKATVMFPWKFLWERLFE